MKIPEPFCPDKNRIKAFVMGCDPSAFTKTEKEKNPENRKHLKFDVVFDIGGNDRYFAGILANLEEVDMGLDDIYVQNLVTKYQKEESSKNKDWIKMAQNFVEERRKEFEDADPTYEIPVLLRSELLYKALLNPQEKRIPAKEFYQLTVEIPIPASTL